MTARRRTPPGRVSRLRLRHSLDIAVRGADLLERKLRILRDHHRKLVEQEHDAERTWRERLGEAETWLLRGLLLSGERALTTAAVAGRADIAVEWTVSMGVRHPSAPSCTDAVRADHEPAPANTALLRAEATYREAVRAAAALAAARTAAGLMAAETERTGRRLRALRRHWIPRLSAELTASDQALEQAEHEDAVRRRWAAAQNRHRSAR
ncbi:V-type ATP synthase subunit D [Kitasatospora sp. NPDC127111]|uniref:V-type ATP synthase subunit D n=1 Tax=Kitasatospora sp. NPDC127111 TaxID=3345363 RepID=UPI00362A2DD1